MILHALRRNPWPYAIVAFFAVAVTLMATFIAFVTRHPEELVRADYYEEEIRFQKRMDSMERTAPSPARIDLSDDGTGRTIVVTLPPRHAGRSSGGSIRLYRPSDSALDRELRLAAGSDGVQRVDARGLRSGLWKVRVEWTVDGLEYYSAGDIVVGDPRT